MVPAWANSHRFASTEQATGFRVRRFDDSLGSGKQDRIVAVLKEAAKWFFAAAQFHLGLLTAKHVNLRSSRKRFELAQHRRDQLRNRRMDMHGALDDGVRRLGVHDVEN